MITKITRQEAIAASKNGRVDIPSFGAELSAAHSGRVEVDGTTQERRASLATRGDEWTIRLATKRQVMALLSSHEGDQLPEDRPVQWIDRSGELVANVGGEEIKFSDAVKAIR